jgi:hypothetical protein
LTHGSLVAVTHGDEWEAPRIGQHIVARLALGDNNFMSTDSTNNAAEQDADFRTMLERRVEDYDAGRTTAADWADVAVRLRDALAKKSSP